MTTPATGEASRSLPAAGIDPSPADIIESRERYINAAYERIKAALERATKP